MTVYCGTFADTPPASDPFTGATLRWEENLALRVVGGEITDRGPAAELRQRFAEDEVVNLTEGIVLPGFVDTHVHYPQVRVIGGLGMPLLDWLDQCALPEEARLANLDYAQAVATDFVSGLVQAGTTSALVFGSHFAGAVDAFFTEATRVGIRATSGLVVSDRNLRPELHTTPEQAITDSLALAQRWHQQSRTRYAITPRFSLSCTEAMLAACGEIDEQLTGAYFTSHVNENLREVATVKDLFPNTTYVGTYDKHGLLGPRSILAHNVHPSDGELQLMAAQQATTAHCPTSNSALGSGLFGLRRHLDHGVGVALGTDVGAGTGFSLYKEGLQAYFMQQLLGTDGVALQPAHLLHLATTAGASALGLPEVGHFSPGMRFDAQWLRPAAGSPLAVGLAHAENADQVIAKVFALATPADITEVWIDGERALPQA